MARVQQVNGHARNVVLDLVRHARDRPEAPAVLLGDRDIGYRRLAQGVGRAAAYLRSQGVAEQNVVGLSFRDDTAKIIALLAVGWVGATAYSIPATATARRRGDMARTANVAVVLTDAASGEQVW